MEDSNQKEIVQGYEIKRSVFFEDNQGFALAESPTAPDPFVTWQFKQDDNGLRDYFWGRYCSTIESATKSYENRVLNHIIDNGFVIADMNGTYKYFSTQRPVYIGTYPNPIENTPLHFYNLDKREFNKYEQVQMWGYLVYDSPLTEKQIDDYELHPSLDNYDIRAKTYEQAQVVGHWEDMKGLPKDERLTWFAPSTSTFEVCYRFPPITLKEMTKCFDHAKREFAYMERKSAQKPIKEQLDEAEKLVERGDPQKSDKKKNRDER